jgi:hypothetical protein
VELTNCSTYVLNWKLCINGKGDLAWAYVRCDNICFNNKIKVEEENKVTSIKKFKSREQYYFVYGKQIPIQNRSKQTS